MERAQESTEVFPSRLALARYTETGDDALLKAYFEEVKRRVDEDLERSVGRVATQSADIKRCI